MKGRKGGEGPQVGVTPTLAPPPSTNGARVMAAAKRRKRGGRVAPAVADSGPKVEGKMAAKRLDKPQRARGGSVDKQKYGGSGLEDAGKATLKSISDRIAADAPKSDNRWPSTPGMKTAMKKLDNGDKAKRARGGSVKGEIGADTKPFTHAKTKTLTKGHATEANIT